MQKPKAPSNKALNSKAQPKNSSSAPAKLKPGAKNTAAPSAEELIKRVLETGEGVLGAGLSRIAKKQDDTSRIFNELVKRGKKIELQTKRALQEQLLEVKSKVNEHFTSAKHKTLASIDQIEQSLSENINHTLDSLAEQTNQHLKRLNKRVAQLEETIAKISSKNDASEDNKE